MFRIFPLFVFIGAYTIACSQTEPQFTQYMYNRYLFNPAYAGSYDGIDASFLYRAQYVNLSDRAISTEGFNVNLPIAKISSGVGVTVINDMVGFQRSTYVSLDYNYRKNFKWGKMGIGLAAGIIQTSLDGSQLRTTGDTYTGGDVNHNDPSLPNTLQNGIAPDISFGIYFNNDRYFAGASLSHIDLSSARIKTSTGSVDLNYARNLFITGGYDFRLSSKLSIMPSTIIKTDLKQVQVDVGGTLTIIDNILTGITFRGYNKSTIDALSLVFGFKYKGFQLVYSYDANLSYLTNFNSGSHEISLNYRYGFKKKETRGFLYHNPRFD